MNLFFRWISKPAKWYQFWLPDSGMAGGLIFGAIINIVGICLLCLFVLTSCTTPTSPSPCPTVKENQNDTTITKDSCVTGVTGGIENPGVGK